jgi:hypothetical protein
MRARKSARFGPLAVTKPVPIPVLPTRHPDPIRPQPASLAPLLQVCPPPPGRRTSMTPGARRGDQPGQPRSEPDLLQRRGLAGQAAGRQEYQGLHTLLASSLALLPPRERNRNTLVSGALVPYRRIQLAAFATNQSISHVRRLAQPDWQSAYTDRARAARHSTYSASPSWLASTERRRLVNRAGVHHELQRAQKEYTAAPIPEPPPPINARPPAFRRTMNARLAVCVDHRGGVSVTGGWSVQHLAPVREGYARFEIAGSAPSPARWLAGGTLCRPPRADAMTQVPSVSSREIGLQHPTLNGLLTGLGTAARELRDPTCG